MSKDAPIVAPAAPAAPAAPVVKPAAKKVAAKAATYLVKRKAFWLGRLYEAGETIHLEAGQPVSSAFEEVTASAAPAPVAPVKPSGRPSDKDVA